MNDAVRFGVVILLVSGALVGAVLSNRLSERIRVPAPALFLVIASLLATRFPELRSVPILTDERIVTVALIFILFDGGLQIGWPEFRRSAGVVLWLGVVGTFVTAAALSVAAHTLFGFGWLLALLLGTALAPTDPAMVFSVLGNREISGRTDTILKGESGANDPVGIALMAVLLTVGGTGLQSVAQGAGIFALQMGVGAVVGLVGGYLLVLFMRHVPLPNEALYPVRTLACAAAIYGAAAVLHGSGFLAVLLAGIVAGDARAPYKREIEKFSSGVSSLAEIIVFAVLGLTVDLGAVVRSDMLWIGLATAALLILVVRPLLVGLLMLPVDLQRGEKVFVLWAGLKGAVPILLGMFALEAGVDGAHRLYGVVFVVVLVSAVAQGGLVPAMARWLRVPMRNVELEPWSLGMRFRTEPDGLQRHFVAAGSPADGCTIADLDLGEDAWISMVSRSGQLVRVHGGTALQPGDEVLAIGRPTADLRRLFEGPQG